MSYLLTRGVVDLFKIKIVHKKGATEIAGQENARLENDGQICRGGKCRTGN